MTKLKREWVFRIMPPLRRIGIHSVKNDDAFCIEAEVSLFPVLGVIQGRKFPDFSSRQF